MRYAQIVFILLALLWGLPATAAPPPGSSGEFAAWFRGLHSADGMGCCDEADCRRIPDDQWRLSKDGYEVQLKPGMWVAVPPDRVVHTNNPTGEAVLCAMPDIGVIFCFVPGVEV